jgi:phosphohistidine phosphatase SixA
MWLARHHYAGDPSDDPETEINRPLTEEGKAAAKAMAKAIGAKPETPKSIFCSPYKRTQMTAFIYGRELVANVAVIGDLAPIRPLTDGLFSLIGSKERIRRVMLVGHRDNIEPLFRDLDGPKFEDIAMGEVRRIQIDRKTGAWTLDWALKPSDLGFEDHYT